MVGIRHREDGYFLSSLRQSHAHGAFALRLEKTGTGRGGTPRQVKRPFKAYGRTVVLRKRVQIGGGGYSSHGMGPEGGGRGEGVYPLLPKETMGFHSLRFIMHVMASKGVCRSLRPLGQCRQVLERWVLVRNGTGCSGVHMFHRPPAKVHARVRLPIPALAFWASPLRPLEDPEVPRSSRGLHHRPARYPSSHPAERKPPATSWYEFRIRPVHVDAPLCFPSLDLVRRRACIAFSSPAPPRAHPFGTLGGASGA